MYTTNIPVCHWNTLQTPAQNFKPTKIAKDGKCNTLPQINTDHGL